MKFYLDQNLSPAIAVAARALGLDVTEWRSDRMAGTSDADQLAHAVASGRCLVTLDQADFLPLSEARRIAGEPHFGVLVIFARVYRVDTGRVAEALRRFAAEHPEGMAAYAVGSLALAPRER